MQHSYHRQKNTPHPWFFFLSQKTLINSAHLSVLSKYFEKIVCTYALSKMIDLARTVRFRSRTLWKCLLKRKKFEWRKMALSADQLTWVLVLTILISNYINGRRTPQVNATKTSSNKPTKQVLLLLFIDQIRYILIL